MSESAPTDESTRKRHRTDDELEAIKILSKSSVEVVGTKEAKDTLTTWRTCFGLYKSAAGAWEVGIDEMVWKESRLPPVYMANTFLGLVADPHCAYAVRANLGQYTGPEFDLALGHARERQYIPLEQRVRQLRAEAAERSKLGAAEIRALDQETEPTNPPWTGYLGEFPSGEGIGDHLDLLLRTIETTPKSTIVFRGQRTDAGIPLPGQSLVLPTILSTTFDLRVTEKFTGKNGIVMVMHVDEGARLLYLATGEQECLLASGSILSFMHEKRTALHRVVHVRVSPGPSDMTRSEALARIPPNVKTWSKLVEVLEEEEKAEQMEEDRRDGKICNMPDCDSKPERICTVCGNWYCLLDAYYFEVPKRTFGLCRACCVDADTWDNIDENDFLRQWRTAMFEWNEIKDEYAQFPWETVARNIFKILKWIKK